GIALDRVAELFVCLLGVMKAGAAYIPLDPQYPKDRIEFMLEDSGATFFITSDAYQGHFTSSSTELLLDKIWEQLDRFDKHPPKSGVTGDDLAYILYTSGSTGKPKGVQIEHRSLVNFLLSMQEAPGMTAEDTLLAL